MSKRNYRFTIILMIGLLKRPPVLIWNRRALFSIHDNCGGKHGSVDRYLYGYAGNKAHFSSFVPMQCDTFHDP